MLKSKKKVGIVIQARMSSKRFPGKSTALLNGIPVIEHVIRNAMMIRPYDELIVAVPDLPESEPILKIADNLGIKNFCGSELDVLDRFYKAAKFFNLDIVGRVTGDCPFLNGNVCSEVLQILQFRKLDYCSNVYPRRSFPVGLDFEAMTFDTLEAAWQSTTPLGAPTLLADGPQNSRDREHVTPWVQRTPGLLRICLEQALDCSQQDLCVDTPDDIQRLEAKRFTREAIRNTEQQDAVEPDINGETNTKGETKNE